MPNRTLSEFNRTAVSKTDGDAFVRRTVVAPAAGAEARGGQAATGGALPSIWMR